MARHHRTSRTRRAGSYTSKRRSGKRPSRRYSAASGGFKRAGKGSSKAASGPSKGFGIKTSTILIAGLAAVGGVYWMAQKRAAANAAAQAQAMAAVRAKSGAPFPTASSAMLPAPQNAGGNFLSPIMDLFKPLVPNSPVPG